MRKLALVLLSIFATAASAEQYLCIADQVTGFIFQNGKWEDGTFELSGEKFIIREIEKGYKFFKKERPYGVYVLGGKYPRFECIDPDDNYYGNFMCEGGIGQFFFSPEYGRYLRTYTAGYWDPEMFLGGYESNYDTPHMEIGRCSKI